jgi:hypothetical protein
MAGQRLDNPSLYQKDMYKAERMGSKEEEVYYNRLFKIVNGVTGAGDKYTQLLGASELDRHTSEGQDIAFESTAEGWTTLVKYHTYSKGLSFSPESVEDTVKLGNIVKDVAATWGRRVRQAKERLAAGIFNNGGDLLGSFEFNGSWTGNAAPYGNLMYDNKPFFNLTGNTRTNKAGSTYYNSVASLTVTPDNFETIYNLLTATNKFDEEDIPVGNKPDTMLTREGADYFKAWRILRTSGASRSMPGGSLNDANPYEGLIKNIWSWSYLDETAFYVGKAQCPEIEFHERMSPDIQFFEHRPNAGYRASIRVRFGIHLKPQSWRKWARGGGTSA